MLDQGCWSAVLGPDHDHLHPDHGGGLCVPLKLYQEVCSSFVAQEGISNFADLGISALLRWWRMPCFLSGRMPCCLVWGKMLCFQRGWMPCCSSKLTVRLFQLGSLEDIHLASKLGSPKEDFSLVLQKMTSAWLSRRTSQPCFPKIGQEH